MIWYYLRTYYSFGNQTSVIVSLESFSIWWEGNSAENVWSPEVKSVGNIWTCFNAVFPWYINRLLKWMTHNRSLLFLALSNNFCLIFLCVRHGTSGYITRALSVYLIRFIPYPTHSETVWTSPMCACVLWPKSEHRYQTISRKRKVDCEY